MEEDSDEAEVEDEAGVTAGSRAEKMAELEGIRELEVAPELARPRLLELLGDEDGEVRAQAAAAVWSYYDVAEIVERTLALSKSDPEPPVRRKATSSLGRVIYEGDVAGASDPDYKPDEALGEPSAALFRRVREHLLALAQDEKRTLDERRFAVEGLGFQGSHADVHALVKAFHAMTDAKARRSALFAMGRSGDPRFSDAIVAALSTDDRETKLQAIWAAGEAEVAAAIPALTKIASNGKPEERRVAVEALGWIGGPDVGKLLLRVAESDGDAEVRSAATLALEDLALGEGEVQPTGAPRG